MRGLRILAACVGWGGICYAALNFTKNYVLRSVVFFWSVTLLLTLMATDYRGIQTRDGVKIKRIK